MGLYDDADDEIFSINFSYRGSNGFAVEDVGACLQEGDLLNYEIRQDFFKIDCAHGMFPNWLDQIRGLTHFLKIRSYGNGEIRDVVFQNPASAKVQARHGDFTCKFEEEIDLDSDSWE